MWCALCPLSKGRSGFIGGWDPSWFYDPFTSRGVPLGKSWFFVDAYANPIDKA